MSPPGLVLAVRMGSALLADALMVTAYYRLPLNRAPSGGAAVGLVVLLTAFLAILGWQLWSVVHSRHPGARALQALMFVVPLFVLCFAATYVLMSHRSPGSFSQPALTHTDGLYFTLTTFSTTGYGDITPASQAAREVVMVQMVLDLLLVGVVLRVFVGAVRSGQRRVAAREQESPPAREES